MTLFRAYLVPLSYQPQKATQTTLKHAVFYKPLFLFLALSVGVFFIDFIESSVVSVVYN